jgi:hypothetical protein
MNLTLLNAASCNGLTGSRYHQKSNELKRGFMAEPRCGVDYNPPVSVLILNFCYLISPFWDISLTSPKQQAKVNKFDYACGLPLRDGD